MFNAPVHVASLAAVMVDARKDGTTRSRSRWAAMPLARARAAKVKPQREVYVFPTTGDWPIDANEVKIRIPAAASRTWPRGRVWSWAAQHRQRACHQRQVRLRHRLAAREERRRARREQVPLSRAHAHFDSIHPAGNGNEITKESFQACHPCGRQADLPPNGERGQALSSPAASAAIAAGAGFFGGVAAATLYAPSAMAQIQFGAIQGIVTNQDNGKPLPGVTVVVSGPALQGDQTEVSDSGGRYLITQLPPGDNYVIRYYFNDVVVERPGVRISLNKTLTVPVKMPTTKGRTDKIVLRERAPNVDTATANTGVEVTQEILQNTAVRGRTYESVMSLAPGSADVAPRAGGR